jgi:hypothetical protein
VVPRLPADPSVLFFLLEARAVFRIFRAAGETCSVERALKKAGSTCLCMMIRQVPVWKKGNFK